MRRGTGAIVAVFCGVALLALPAAAKERTQLLRFPDISGDTIVFCYGGDLWRVPASGGVASRLTAHPGVELFPRFSPDGARIAFTGQYDGDEQVYVIPAEGGEPRQLTWYPAHGPLPPRWGSDNQVLDWTPDGGAVLFRSMRDAGGGSAGRVYTVSLDGGLPVALPMPEAGVTEYAPDGKRVVYSPLDRDFRTWKRYQGGWAEDLFILDLATLDRTRIAHTDRTERDPMWIGDSIYFVSDRDGWLNLYRYRLDGGAVEQLTHSTTWDVRWPGYDPATGRIVYEYGGSLRVYDTATGEDREVSVTVPDDGLWKRHRRVDGSEFIEDFDIGPTGKRALFVARGDILTVPAKYGPTRNLTRSSGAHDREAAWSPDGKWIAYVSDATGEDELWIVPADGKGKARQLTTGGTMRRIHPVWSPDSRRIAVSDVDGRIDVVTVADGATVRVADEPNGQVTDYAWSPDSRWLAFSLSDPTRFRSIYLWKVGEAAPHRVTGPSFNEWDPAWSPDGKYLYFLADHSFAPQHAQVEWNYAIDRQAGIYALALAKDTPDPFAPRSDEEKAGEETAGDGTKERSTASKDDTKDSETKQPEPVRIDLEGLAERVSRVPVPFENYHGLVVTEKVLVFVRVPASFEGREPAWKPELHVFGLEKRKDSVFLTGGAGYAVSADGKKILVRRKGAWSLYDLGPKAGDPTALDLSGMTIDVDPPAEWRQIFWEVWRRYRDFFYVPNMHGYDWKAIGERYAKLLPAVAHRSDLNYLLGEMIAELSIGHAYVEGGDYDIPDRTPVALPGARFELDAASGRYRITRIFRGENAEPRYRCPLRGIGVDAQLGDYVLAIDGQELEGTGNPYRLLRGRAGHPVELTLNLKPTLEGARKVTFVPRTDEAPLIYDDWVAANRERVAKLSGGRVGYIHIPDMGSNGAREFIKWFYPQTWKEGLVVDERFNGGGYISQWIIERLRRTLLGLDYARHDRDPETYPSRLVPGPMVALINGTTASDGDIFAYMFRKAGLGPLVGTRTWGGVVGISGHGPLIDGGTVYVPEFASASTGGHWIIEGKGVAPDIEVEQDPKAVAAGHDPQLERAVEEILKRLPDRPSLFPPRPGPPVKTPVPIAN